MAKCIQYSDITDCDKATCTGCPMRVEIAEPTCPRYATPLCDVCGPDDRQPGCYLELTEQEDDDPCDKCCSDNGGCKLGTDICNWPQELDTRPCVVDANDESEPMQCFECGYRTFFSCPIGRC